MLHDLLPNGVGNFKFYCVCVILGDPRLMDRGLYVLVYKLE
jgi:hypothetical protein